MASSHVSEIRQALYHVFIATRPRNAASLPLFSAQATTARLFKPPYNHGTLQQTCIRGMKYKKDTRRHAISDHYIIDDAITADYVNLVDEQKEFRTHVPISEALSSYDRKTFHLVQVNPGRVDEDGIPYPDSVPTCRIVSKINLRAMHEKKLDTARRQAKGQVLKSLELNWAIARGDLNNRTKQLKAFLAEGRKVEVMLGPKKHGRRASAEEADAVLRAVRGAVSDCKGSREVKAEGDLGGIMTIVFQGQKIEKEKKADTNISDDQGIDAESEEIGENQQEGTGASLN